MSKLEFEPATIKEWNDEREAFGVLAGDEESSENEAKTWMNEMQIELPQQLSYTELLKYAAKIHTPFGPDILTDSKNYDYYLIQVPLTIIVPVNKKLVRLRLGLDLQAEGKKSGDVVAYDVFPKTEKDVNEVMSGKATLDVSKFLKYITKLAGVMAPLTAIPAAAIGESFGLNLDLPFKWTSEIVKLQASGPMSNPVQWDVRDSAIQNGFIGHIILRAPKGSKVHIAAKLAFELRGQGPIGSLWHDFKSSEPHTFAL